MARSHIVNISAGHSFSAVWPIISRIIPIIPIIKLAPLLASRAHVRQTRWTARVQMSGVPEPGDTASVSDVHVNQRISHGPDRDFDENFSGWVFSIQVKDTAQKQQTRKQQKRRHPHTSRHYVTPKHL